MILYHITKKRYLKDILKNGLKSNHSNRGMASDKKQKQVIWLTDDVEYVKNTMLSPEYINENEMIVLKINVENNFIGARAVYPTGIMKICPHEYFAIHNISPNDIMIL